MRALLLIGIAACGSDLPHSSGGANAPGNVPPPAKTVVVDERFVVAMDLVALRGTDFGARVLHSLGKATASTNERIGFSPFEEGAWITLAGPEISLFDNGHLAIVAHTKSEEHAAAIVKRAGGANGEVSLYGVRGNLTRPRSDLFLFAPDGSVPSLAKRRGEEALHISLRKLDAGFWPKEIGRIDIAGRVHDGFDLEARAECPSPELCASLAKELREKVRAVNERVRGVTRDAFVPLEKEDGLGSSDHALHAHLHLDAEQLRVLTDLALAFFGLP